jgi:DNA polymerase III subunit delta'
VDKKQARLYSELFDGHIGTVLATARDDARQKQMEKALTLAKTAAAHNSYATTILLAGYEKDKATAAALLDDFRAVAAARLRGCASTPLTDDNTRRALSLADATIQQLAAQMNPKITLSILAAKLK